MSYARYFNSFSVCIRRGRDAPRNSALLFRPSRPRRDCPPLCAALSEFAGRCHEFGSRTSLVAFFEPDASIHTLEGYKLELWRLLSGVSAIDDQLWPAGIAIDPDSPEWEFCSFGVPFFVVANTPAHRARASRYSEFFTITFQPRFVFDDLGPDSVAGRNARKIIRARLCKYDAVPPHPQLGSFGQAGNREWVQYFLDDDNVPVTSKKCPLNRRERIEGLIVSGPEFANAPLAEIPPDLLGLVPDQGSIELQHDQPGKVFGWHQHDLNEELYVLSGDLTLFWVGADGDYNERYCEPGHRIRLPARTVHGSTAGSNGVYYVIRPEGGKTAVTTFLREEQWPYPVVAPDCIG